MAKKGILIVSALAGAICFGPVFWQASLNERPPPRPPESPLLPERTAPDRKVITRLKFVTPDFSAHPLAGAKVDMTLAAKNAAGQTGLSEVFRGVELPGLPLTHPVARVLQTLRRDIYLYPSRAGLAAEEIDKILEDHSDLIPTFSIYLALEVMRDELAEVKNLPPGEQTAGVDRLDPQLRYIQSLLQAKLPTDAEKKVREAIKALEKAMQKNAPKEQLEKLREDVRKALEKLLQEKMADENLKKSLEQDRQNQQKNNDQKQGEQKQDSKKNSQKQDGKKQDSPEKKAQQQKPTLTPEQQEKLDKAMEEMKKMMDEMAKMSPKAAAQQMKQQAEQAMKDMQNGESAEQTLEQMTQKMEQMRQQMRQMQKMQKMQNQLQEMIKKQQDLLDKTFQEKQKGGDGKKTDKKQDGKQQDGKQQDGNQEGDLQEQQDGLKKQLEEMMGQMGGKPGKLKDADKNMEEASGQLKQGKPGEAVPPQGQALQNLKAGAKELQKQMQQMQQGKPGGPLGPPGGPPGPPGSPGQGEGDGTGGGQGNGKQDSQNGDGDGATLQDEPDMKLPTSPEENRARDIQNELNKRSADPGRSTLEHNYIERLLKRGP